MSKAVKLEAPQKVDYNDAVAESKKYFDGDDLAATVWVSKYALKDSFGNIYETSPRQMHERIAAEIERIERKYPNPMSREEVFGLLDHFRYVIPQGGPMTGIGNNFQVASLSNCFVIGHKHPADSYGGIFRMDEEQVQLMKRRGGVGHDLSHIRPTGSPVLNSALTSTGIVPFMERYSNSTREVAQDGRRGALMLSLSIKHPDAERFIDAKVDTGKVTGANVSIKIDDEFMRAAIAGKKYHQQFPINSDNPRYEQDIDARKLWDKIIHNAWKSAEPGVLFWDTIIRESVPDCYADEGFVTVSTNPCGEIPLCPYDSCRLLALNLLSYVDNPFKKDAKFNFDKFRSHVAMAMRMMDDIIDLELEKVEQIIGKIAADPEDEDVRRVELELWKKILGMAQKGRRTGLGITAEGDMLAALGLVYGSEEAIAFAVEVQKTLAVEAYRASVKMAAERGAFPVYYAAKEKDNPMIARIREADPELYAEMEKVGRRNIAMLTIALITFPVGRANVIDTMGQNHVQLDKIERLMDTLINQYEFFVDSITITASSSPDGSMATNNRIAGERARAIKERLVRKFGHEVDTLIRTRSIGEDWTLLKRLIRHNSDMPNWEQIMAMIDQSSNLDVTEPQIRKQFPKDYAYMKEILYPQLRAVDFRYNLRRVDMVKDTVVLTVLDTTYMRGVQQLRDRDYVGALRTLNDYKCQNLAIVLLSLSYDEAAFEILEQLPPAEKNPRTDYLSAIALSRMNRPREGLEYYLKAIQADPVLKFRGNLDPEIQILYKQNNVKASW